MHSLLRRLLALPPNVTTPTQQALWAQFLEMLPDLPVNHSTGALEAADVLPTDGRHNVESPELYAVHPYRFFSVAQELTANISLLPAIAAFYIDPYAQQNQVT
jgi:alpha-L-fucosidase 2